MTKAWPRFNFRRKPHFHALKTGGWKARARPAACDTVPTMLMDDELRLLECVTEKYCTGAGLIIDAGCFLGGSTLALASGLRRNLARHSRPETAQIHSFDLFEIEDWTRGVYFPESRRAGESIRGLFDDNIRNYAPLVVAHEGDITQIAWPEGAIEILFIDVAKHWTVCDWITEHIFPRLIAGKSIIIQQDYLYHHWVAWLHITMEYFSENFEMLCDTEHNSVAFGFVKPFAKGAIRPNLVGSMPMSEKVALMDRAASRFKGHKADLLRSAKAHFIEMLRDA
jgi:hypothetical protein